jgi:hypothetical protein
MAEHPNMITQSLDAGRNRAPRLLGSPYVAVMILTLLTNAKCTMSIISTKYNRYDIFHNLFG